MDAIDVDYAYYGNRGIFEGGPYQIDSGFTL